MSIDMYLTNSQNQAVSVSKVFDSKIHGYEEVQLAIKSFAFDSSFLVGNAYDSARTYYSSVLLPLAKGGMMLSEEVKNAVNKFPVEYISQVDSGDLKQSELDDKILRAGTLLSQAEEIRTNLLANDTTSLVKFHQLAQNEVLIDIYTNVKKRLEDKLKKLLLFNTSSPNIFSEISTLQELINQGLAKTKNAWDSSTGTFITPNDLSWAHTINFKWAMQDVSRMSKLDYIQNLQDQFGFDMETAKQIYEIKMQIDGKFPELSQNEKDYILLNLLGSISYEGFKWTHTAGSLAKYFYKTVELSYPDGEGTTIIPKSVEEILIELGLSERESKIFCYTIRIQHAFSGSQYKLADKLIEKDYKDFKDKAELAYGKMSEDEFERLWNSNILKFYGKADFAHQSITMATNLYTNKFRLANLMGLSHQFTNELSGWRGDTTKGAETQPSIGNDDYKADLDAVNILALMEQKSISYLEASNLYYSSLSAESYTRAEKFKENVGFDYIKSEILQSLAPKYEYILGSTIYQTNEELRPDDYGTMSRRVLNDKEKLEYIKIHYPMSYDFIISLENNQNNYVHYVEEGK